MSPVRAIYTLLSLMKFYYVYILANQKDRHFYAGFSTDLVKGIKEHNDGKIHSTKSKLPWKIIYYEAFLNKYDARRREKYLKSTKGKNHS